ncbi:MAG TPA: ATP-grasp domain-containing protein [Acidimicrobiales bacterium]|nr:ATP-grasp domain-containing protein [Acidimicrobiales bacterium]
MPRVLLLVPSATYRAGDFLDAARAMGVEVVVGGDGLTAMARTMGSRALEVPLGDAEAATRAIVAHDAKHPLDAVVAVDDRGTVAAASASARLGLRANPPDAVAAACDKFEMRTRLDSAEVSQPAFTLLPPDAEPAQAAAIAADVGLPCVIKPRTLSGSQGVLRADDARGVADAVTRVRRIACSAGIDPAQGLLVERYVAGPEVAVEALLSDGEIDVLAIFDKPDPLDGPAFEETIYVTPSRLPVPDREAVVTTTQAATRAIGLVDGPVHAELRVAGGRAWVIEVAARTIGGLCARSLTFSLGRSLEELVLAHACASRWSTPSVTRAPPACS